MNIASILRHWFTLAATSATLWLIATLVLSADDAQTLTAEIGKLIEPLVIIGALLVTAFWRVALTWIGKILGHGTGELENKGGGSGGNLPSILLLCMGLGIMGCGLVSCTAAQLAAARAVPIRIGIEGPGYHGSYSAKGGLVVDYRSGK